MRKMVLVGGMLLVLLGVVPQVRADFALGDADRVAFLGNKIIASNDLTRGVETFMRLRYPELQARFRSYGWPTTGVVKGALKRFEDEVMPFKPTVVVLCFGTDDLPQREFNEDQHKNFEAEFGELVGRIKQSGARVYIMTPLCPDASRKGRLEQIGFVDTVGKYAETMRTIAGANGATIVDWFAASQAYTAAHEGKRGLTTTTNGTAPSPLGVNLGAVAVLDAFKAEPMAIAVTGDWNSDAITASVGQASITKVADDKVQLKLSGMPMPWVDPKRGAVTDDDWPGTRYYRFILKIENAPDGGLMISGPEGKDAMPYLSEQLWAGTDLGFVGPLTKLDAVSGLERWLKEKDKAVYQYLDFRRRTLPEPEYKKAYETYYEALDQYVDATDQVVLRLPRTVETTLDIGKITMPPAGEKKVGAAKPRPGVKRDAKPPRGRQPKHDDRKP